MSISPTSGSGPRDVTAGRLTPSAPTAPQPQRFSVLNDFRYLSESDKDLLAGVTGEVIEPGFTDKATPASQFALQLALDRRTGELAPQQDVTAVYLRNRATEIDARNHGRSGARNPYSGEVMVKAVDYLTSVGRAGADIRL